jgi:hypothetical protein
MMEKKIFTYRAFGLNIETELELPEAMEYSFDQPDVLITIKESRRCPKDVLDFKMEPNYFLLNMPNLGEMVVTNGKRIEIHLFDQDESLKKFLRLFVLGSGFGILLFQRGIIPLHGSAVIKDNNALLLLGDSGSGKSTTAHYLDQYHGFELICDDLIAVGFDSKKQPVIWPSYPQIKLNEDSMKVFSLNKEDYPSVENGKNKRKIDIGSSPAHGPFVFSKIYILDPQINSPMLRALSGTAKFETLLKYLFRKEYAFFIQQHKQNFESFLQLLNQTQIHMLYRSNKDTLNANLADMIEIIHSSFYDQKKSPNLKEDSNDDHHEIQPKKS